VTNRLGGEPIRAGFDVRANAQVPFETVRDMVADDIKRTYGLTRTNCQPIAAIPLNGHCEMARRMKDHCPRAIPGLQQNLNPLFSPTL
jgi:hypothetical protein